MKSFFTFLHDTPEKKKVHCIEHPTIHIHSPETKNKIL